MESTRREFLSRAAGASIFFGLPSLLQEPASKPSSRAPEPSRAFRDALESMRANRMYGAAILIPELARDRAHLGFQLQALPTPRQNSLGVVDVVAPEDDLEERLLEVVYVCATRAQVDAREDETVVLLDADGKRVAGANVRFDSRRTFLDTITPLLHGEDRLATRARLVRSPRLERAIQEMTMPEEDPVASRAADAHDLVRAARIRFVQEREFVRASIDGCAPALIEARLAFEKSNPLAAERIRKEFQLRFGYRTRFDRSTLPFGVEWSTFESSGLTCHSSNAPCGMAIAVDTSRRFVRFLTD